MTTNTPQLYWLEGLDWFRLLEKHKYCWARENGDTVGSGTIGEKDLTETEAYCISIMHDTKVVHWFPLEIYAPGSPTQNKEKFDSYVNLCRSDEELIADVTNAEAKR